MMMSGFCSAIFFTAAAPLLTATTSYPASERIFLPMFWAVMLSSANRILSDTSETPSLKLHVETYSRVYLVNFWRVQRMAGAEPIRSSSAFSLGVGKQG